MKKILVLVVIALFLFTSMSYAAELAKKVYSYNILNTGKVPLITTIPTTSIRPEVDKIIGYSIFPLADPAEMFIGLFDGTDKLLAGEVFAENEVNANIGFSEMWLYGKYIFEGVVVNQGAKTSVIVYFVRE